MSSWKQCENPDCSKCSIPVQTQYCSCVGCEQPLYAVPEEEMAGCRPRAHVERQHDLERRLGIPLAVEVAEGLFRFEDAYHIRLYGSKPLNTAERATRRLEFARWLVRELQAG